MLQKINKHNLIENMANNTIKVSEVSELLRMQLEGIDTDVKFDETGTVISVSDGVVRIFGLRNAESNELLEFDNGMQAIVMNLEEDNVGAILLGASNEIKEGFIVASSNIEAETKRFMTV